MAPRALLKRLLHAGFGDYEYWKVFAIDLPQTSPDVANDYVVRQVSGSELRSHEDAGISSRANYDGPESLGFGLFVSGELACIQWYWWGARYRKERGGRSWELPAGAAKSVGLYTVPRYRGRGLATILKRRSADLMYEKGFVRLYSRIWHNHTHSIRVSEKVGWVHVGWYIEVNPLRRNYCFRIKRRHEGTLNEKKPRNRP